MKNDWTIKKKTDKMDLQMFNEQNEKKTKGIHQMCPLNTEFTWLYTIT